MLSAAKHGNFKEALSIIAKKSYLINAIPAGRAWSVLHQAVYHDDIHAIKKLLQYPNCNVKIKAKRQKVGIEGITPVELARKLRK